MYKRIGEKKLGKKASHRRSLIMNQLQSLFEEGKVKTTTPKAKMLKSSAESLVLRVKGAENELSLLREMKKHFANIDMVQVILENAKKAESIKIAKIGFRSGDNAEVSEVSIQYAAKAK